jgi:hypothetical protein
MYTVLIPSNRWFEIHLWLEQNYLCNRRDYTFRHVDNAVEITVVRSDIYELLCRRWGLST